MKILSPGTSGQNKCLVENERFSSHTSSFVLSGVSIQRLKTFAMHSELRQMSVECCQCADLFKCISDWGV